MSGKVFLIHGTFMVESWVKSEVVRCLRTSCVVSSWIVTVLSLFVGGCWGFSLQIVVTLSLWGRNPSSMGLTPTHLLWWKNAPVLVKMNFPCHKQTNFQNSHNPLFFCDMNCWKVHTNFFPQREVRNKQCSVVKMTSASAKHAMQSENNEC